MPLQEIAQYIENSTAWMLGVNMFAGFLPEKLQGGGPPPERCVVLLERTPGAVVGELPDRIDKEVQVWNRAGSVGGIWGYWTARDDAYGIYWLLHGDAGRHLPILTSSEEYFCGSITAVATPAPIASPNERGLFEFSTNYIFKILRPNFTWRFGP